jgi:hypothetical protein
VDDVGLSDEELMTEESDDEDDAPVGVRRRVTGLR